MSLKPDYLIINLPSNNASSLIPAQTTMEHYRAVKAMADRAGVKTFIISPQPRNMGSTKKEILLAELDSVRAGFGQYVIDVFDTLAESNGHIKAEFAFDGIHLNEAGHAYMFREVESKLLEHLVHFEIYKSATSGGSFSLLGGVENGKKLYLDTGLEPGSVFYYKVKALNKNGASGFSSVVSAINSLDTQTPSVPTGLVAVNTTYTNSSFKWVASTDNDLVERYEIMANDVLIGESTDNTFYTTDFLPDSTYLVKVRAIDRSGNTSAYSAAISVTSSQPIIYFSKASGNLNSLATWGTNTDGNGTAPASFSYNGQLFRVANRGTSALSSDWTVGGLISKLVVTTNESLELNSNLYGKIELEENGSVTVNSSSMPVFVASSANSNVTLNNNSEITQGSFGNLMIGGTGITKLGRGDIMVKGNLTVADGVTLKGNTGNTSLLTLRGDITIAGIQDNIAQGNMIALAFEGGKKHQITTADNLNFFQLSLADSDTLELLSSAPAITLQNGNAQGGGIKLGNNALLDVSHHNLSVTGAASINSENNTGRIAIEEGNMTINVASPNNSHLYFDANRNNVTSFEVNLSGSGIVAVEDTLKIITELNLTDGSINSNGHIILKSDADETAVIRELPASAQILGDIQAERFVSSNRAYRYMSSPVSGVTVADWQNYFPVSGNFTGASTGPGILANASLYRYNEDEGGWLAHPAPGTTNAAPIEVGVGYAPFFRNSSNSIVVKNTGNPTQGDFTFNLSGGSGSPADDGWNLIANPYASTIKWDATNWNSSGLSDIIAVTVNTAGGNSQFLYYDRSMEDGTLPDGYIASGQGFWVQTLNATPSLTITEKAKVSAADASQAIYYRNAKVPLVGHLMISLLDNTTDVTDKTIVKFNASGVDGYYKKEDGFKRPNTQLNFYSLTADGEKVAINTLSDQFCEKSVVLNMNNVSSGSYSISAENINEFNVAEVTLVDQFENQSVALSGLDTYTFVIDAADAATYQNRFTLNFSRTDINTNLILDYEDQLCISG